MFHESFYKKLFRSWKLIILVGLSFAVISFLFSFIFSFEYRSDAQVLVISKSRYGVDPYTVIKSAERVGENIVKIINTGDFYQKAKEVDKYNVDWTKFDSLSEVKRRKLWNKSVVPSVIYGTGIVQVSTYHKKPEQALALAAVVSDALVKKGWEYVGGDVTIKVVNNPVVTSYPVRPNLPINMILGFLVGVGLAGLWIYRR